MEQVHPATAGANASASWDSDVDVEPDPPDWSQGVAEDVLARLGNAEKKRQEVINGQFGCLLLFWMCDCSRKKKKIRIGNAQKDLLLLNKQKYLTFFLF